MKTESILDDKLGSILFICIVLSFCPILISTLFIPDFLNSIIFTFSMGLIFLLQSLILMLVFFFRTKGELLFNKNLLLFSWLFLLAQAVTVVLSLYNGIKIDSFDFINVFVRFIALLVFFCLPALYSLSKSGVDRFMFLILMFGLIACIYNIIIHFKDILNIINIHNPNSVNLSSFFSNRNSFAQYLFICLIANTYLFVNKKSNLYLFFYIVLGINIVATFSRTGTISTIIFLLLFYLFYYRRKVLFILTVFFSIFLFFVVVLYNSALSNFIENFSRLESGTSGRWIIWDFGLQLLDHTSWFFGIGYLTGVSFLEQAGLPGQFHSFFVETIVGGGLIDLLLHLLIFIYVIRKVFFINKFDRLVSVIYLASFLSLFAYSLFESVSFFSMGYVDSLFRIFFITIPLLYSNNFEKVIN